MNAEMLKGHLDALALAALEAGPAHGYAVIERLRAVSGGAFDLPESTIYPALHRLEAAGWLSSRWEVSAGARKRRVYALTPEGRTALAARRDDWRRFAGAVEATLACAR
jgi:DNA-binding PadR family transcriptional regulator